MTAHLKEITQPDVLACGGEGGPLGVATRHEAVDNGPELGGVVRLAEVGEFVDENVIDEAWGELEGGPVDVDVLGSWMRAR